MKGTVNALADALSRIEASGLLDGSPNVIDFIQPWQQLRRETLTSLKIKTCFPGYVRGDHPLHRSCLRAPLIPNNLPCVLGGQLVIGPGPGGQFQGGGISCPMTLFVYIIPTAHVQVNTCNPTPSSSDCMKPSSRRFAPAALPLSSLYTNSMVWYISRSIIQKLQITYKSSVV